MTLEGIKQYIKDQLDDEDRDATCSCGDEFACGESTAYSDCLYMLNKYNPWHPYPQEKPDRNDTYLVTVNGKTRTETGYWLGDKGCWSNEEADNTVGYDWFAYSHVVAWMELPKPYEEK